MDRLPPCQVTPTVWPPRRSATLAVTLALALGPTAGLAQGPATLVKDLRLGYERVSSNPNNIVSTFGATRLSFAYFPATGAEVGRELWRTGGTAASTYPVKDINPGPASSNPDQVLAVSSSARAFFVADDGVSGVELWFTDGTPTGTNMVQDIRAGGGGSSPDQLTRLPGGILFTADDGVNGRELWFSDGTAAGTRLVADINPGAAGSNPTQLSVIGGLALFAAENPTYGRELWRTTGLASTTWIVADIAPGTAGSSPRGLTAGATTWFFAAVRTSVGDEPWRSNGVASGTTLLADVRVGPASSSPGSFTPLGDDTWFVATQDSRRTLFWSDSSGVHEVLTFPFVNPDPRELTLVGSQLWFVANDFLGGREVWASTGPTSARVFDVWGGPNSSQPMRFTVSGSRLFFVANGGPALGWELYMGQNNTVTLVGDLHTGPSSSDPDDLAAIGGLLYFSATDGVAAREPWRSDGTAAGTFRLADLWAGAPASFPNMFVPHGACPDCALFIAQNQDGYEVWRTAGVRGDPVMVKDIHPGALSSTPSELTPLNGRLVFAGETQLVLPIPVGRELLFSDGTPGGTGLLSDIHPGAGSSNPSELTVVGDLVLFAADDGVAGRELWRATAVPGSARRVADIGSSIGANPMHLTAMDGVLYFAATPGAFASRELWRSDGFDTGTRRVAATVSDPADLVAMNGVLYFTGVTTSGRELWRSDGTAAGTWLVKDIHPTGHSSPSGLTVVGNTLFFAANDGSTGTELWQSDGTLLGTVRVRDIEPGAGSSSPQHLLAVGGLLFFAANTTASGSELWRSNGTPSGTLQVDDLMPGPASSEPRAFADFNSVLLYAATYNAGINTVGTELRRSDGTAAGTRFVKDIAFGIDPSFPLQDAWIHTLPGAARALLAVTDELKGVELWITDGTAAGTRLHQDLAPGTLSSNPGRPARVGSTLFFAASDGTAIGVELWSMRSMAAAIPYGTGCLGTGGRIPRIGTRGGAPAVGNGAFSVEVTSARSNTLGVLFSCLSPARLPFGGCVLLVDPASLVLSLTATTDASGTGRTTFPIPANQGLLGLRLFQQWGIVDAGSAAGLAFSDGLELVLSDG